MTWPRVIGTLSREMVGERDIYLLGREVLLEVAVT